MFNEIKRDSTLGIISPAWIPNSKKLKSGIRYLESMGFNIRCGQHLTRRHGYFAGTDEQRVDDLHTMYADKEVDIIMCSRGGWGGLRMINGIDYIIITLLDALEGIDPLKICIGYELDGQPLEQWPIQSEIINKCKPIYKTFKGWKARTKEDWSDIAKKGYEALPETMKVYINAIQEELKTELAMISIGPNRNDTIELTNGVF